MYIVSNVTTFNGSTNIYQDAHFRLRNNAARLITLNHTDEMTGEQFAFQIVPGNNEPTPVPASIIESDFAKHLIASGDLLVLNV